MDVSRPTEIQRPDVQYARSGDINIAYTRWGFGDEIVLYLPPWISNVELYWDLPETVRAYERAGRYHQLITFDRRGVGLSDRTNRPASLDDRVKDALAVLDAEGVAMATLVGFSGGAAVAIALAARHPERVNKVLLHGAILPGVPREAKATFALEGDEPPIDRTSEIIAKWGTKESPSIRYYSPSVAGNPRIEHWMRRFERQSASPGALQAEYETLTTMNVEPDLANLHAPLFIGHSRGDLMVPVANARYLAARFPDAELRIWESPDHFVAMSPNWQRYLDDMIEFVAGTRPAPTIHRRFGVVLFTDIVNSTAQSGAVGDEEWSHLVQAHDAIIVRSIEDHGGRRVKGTGDGVLAVFSDPATAIDCAARLRHDLRQIGLEIRAGLHAGQVHEHPDADISGLAVNLAARIESVAESGQITVSRTMTDLLLGGVYSFESLGSHDLKGIAGPVEIFALVD